MQTQTVTTIVAGATARDILAGEPTKLVLVDQVAQLGATIEAGAAIGDVTLNVTVGGRFVTNYAVPVEQAAGQGPAANTDIKVPFAVRASEQILVNAVNNDGAAPHTLTTFVSLPQQ